MEPFLPAAYEHAKVESAYPPNSTRKSGFTPLSISFSWPADRPDLDEQYETALRETAENIMKVAISEGQSIEGAARYPNYAIFGTPLEDLYAENLERLRRLKRRMDPSDIMRGAGGWKL